MSQADRIPARGAHLSGQEPCASVSGPPPGKGCGSRAARPRAPSHRGGGGEEPPPSLRPREPGTSPPHPRLQTRVLGCPGLGVAS